jgi:hypothetical protein
MPLYKRPQLPPLDALRDSTASLRKSNDEREAKLGIVKRAPIGPSQLAPAFRAHNDARDMRAWSEEQENARQELIVTCHLIAGEMTDDRVHMFVQGVLEFLAALGAKSNKSRFDAITAMRQAIASLEEAQTGQRDVLP